MGEADEGRSMRSEYDYGSKRKFVDVLGNIKKDGQSTLAAANLAEFQNHMGAKNMDSAS